MVILAMPISSLTLWDFTACTGKRSMHIDTDVQNLYAADTRNNP